MVVDIAGRSGKRVDHLTFKTSNGDVLDGGGGGGDPFNENVPNGSFLLGFAGRCGSELDQIQFVYGTFLPARWTPIPGLMAPRLIASRRKQAGASGGFNRPCARRHRLDR